MGIRQSSFYCKLSMNFAIWSKFLRVQLLYDQCMLSSIFTSEFLPQHHRFHAAVILIDDMLFSPTGQSCQSIFVHLYLAKVYKNWGKHLCLKLRALIIMRTFLYIHRQLPCILADDDDDSDYGIVVDINLLSMVIFELSWDVTYFFGLEFLFTVRGWSHHADLQLSFCLVLRCFDRSALLQSSWLGLP